MVLKYREQSKIGADRVLGNCS
jgi:hypothetical protein